MIGVNNNIFNIIQVARCLKQQENKSHLQAPSKKKQSLKNADCVKICHFNLQFLDLIINTKTW